MIFDSIHNLENYSQYSALYFVLRYLKNLKPGELPKPGTVIEEASAFLNPAAFTTKPEAECVFEAHKRYIDLHYIVTGMEKIATADVETLREKTPFDCSKDIGFYVGEKAGQYILHEGDFMVCYPSDAHMVAMMVQKPSEVKKIVVKVKYPAAGNGQ